jgi:hypothetical protein
MGDQGNDGVVSLRHNSIFNVIYEEENAYYGGALFDSQLWYCLSRLCTFVFSYVTNTTFHICAYSLLMSICPSHSTFIASVTKTGLFSYIRPNN